MYCCRECGVNWMLETDVSVPGEHEWICLYYSSSILEPGSTLAPPLQANADPPGVTRVNAAHAVESEWPYKILVQLGALPFL